MNDRELEKLLERIEVSIAVQQGVLLAYTKRRDQTIVRPSYAVAAAPKRPIIPSGFYREVDAACVEQLQLEQLAFNLPCGTLVANALENFTENHLRESETLTIQFGMNPIGFGVRNAFEVIDPDGGVNDYHDRYFATRPSRDAPSSVAADDESDLWTVFNGGVRSQLEQARATGTDSSRPFPRSLAASGRSWRSATGADARTASDVMKDLPGQPHDSICWKYGIDSLPTLESRNVRIEAENHATPFPDRFQFAICTFRRGE